MISMSQSGAKKFKKGELLFTENDTVSSLLFIQSGRVKYFLSRGKGLDIQIMNAPFVTGEIALYSTSRYPYSAIALSEVSAFEIPIESAKQTLDGASQFFKTLTKGLTEQLKVVINELKSFKIEQDQTPCPPELIPRLFGGVFHTIKHTGKLMSDQSLEVDWTVMKKYTHRIFNLAQDKVEAVNNLLVKFGYAELKIEKIEEDQETIEQLTKIYYKNYKVLESFFEFYQFYFFKSGKQDILKYEEPIFNILRGLVTLSTSVVPDKSGMVKLDLNQLLDHLKNNYQLAVSASHWQVLENKGLFSKRAQGADGKFYISFHLDDFQKTFLAWRFLREINKWNTLGAINPKEPEFPPQAPSPSTTASMSEIHCPECKALINHQQKFCGECGFKLSEKIAA